MLTDTEHSIIHFHHQFNELGLMIVYVFLSLIQTFRFITFALSQIFC